MPIPYAICMAAAVGIQSGLDVDQRHRAPPAASAREPRRKRPLDLVCSAAARGPSVASVRHCDEFQWLERPLKGSACCHPAAVVTQMTNNTPPWPAGPGQEREREQERDGNGTGTIRERDKNGPGRDDAMMTWQRSERS